MEKSTEEKLEMIQENIVSAKNSAVELLKKHNDLIAEFEQYKKESVKWSVEDFIDKAKEIGYTITDEQAQTALEDMIHHHDCEYGITWGTVEHYVEVNGERISDERINEFLDKFCTKVRSNEDDAYVELMIDDHYCIEYGIKEIKEYYVPENNSSFTPEDEQISDYLHEEYCVY